MQSSDISAKNTEMNSFQLLPPKKILKTPMKSQQSKSRMSRSRSQKRSQSKSKSRLHKDQLRSINRLHSTLPKHYLQPQLEEKEKMKASTISRPQQHNSSFQIYGKVPKLFASNRLKSLHVRSITPITGCRTRSKSNKSKKTKKTRSVTPKVNSHHQFQEYRERLKALEKARYEKKLKEQKDAYETQIKNMNTNTKNRLEIMKHSLQREKSKNNVLVNELTSITGGQPEI